MEDSDIMISHCPSCKFEQPFDFLEYNRTGECVVCEKCKTPYKITSGVVYGREMSKEEYKEWKFMQKLRENS